MPTCSRGANPGSPRSGCTVQESHSASSIGIFPAEVAGDGSAGFNSSGCCCTQRAAAGPCARGAGEQVSVAGCARPIPCVGQSLMVEGCTLQCGFALQPFLIWLRVRGGSFGWEFIVHGGYRAGASFWGGIQGVTVCPSGRQCQGHEHPSSSSRKEEKRSSLMRGKTSK